MRTKKILFTLAIGVLATACSQDEFEAQKEQLTDAKLSIRPEVGNVFKLADDALTRLTTQDGDAARPVFAENDKLGAAIIDVPDYMTPYDPSTVTAISQYKIIEAYGCNNAFTTEDGGTTWASEQPMVEGNYLFYAPYQEGLAFRSPLKVSIPRYQDASETKKALKDFYESGEVVRVGYKFLASGNETKTPSVTMYDVFAYPKFTLKNNFDGYLFDSADGTVASGKEATARYNGAIVIDSIQFVAAGTDYNKIVVGGQLQHGTANALATAATAGVIKVLHEKSNGFTDDGTWSVLSEKLTTKTAELVNATGAETTATRDNLTGLITTVTFGKETGMTLAKGASYSFYAVFPAAQFSFDGTTVPKLNAYVYITIGEKHYKIAQGTFSAPANNQADKLSAAVTASDLGVAFTANDNAGLTTLTFANGQKLPSEAIYIDPVANKLVAKTNVNDLLEIDLVGGLPAVGSTTKQIAVQYNPGVVAVSEVKTTNDLITLINNAATGTNWVQDATDSGTQKGYKIATNNTVELNSALVDALFNNNRYGTLAISTVAPISNDVKVKAVNGTKVTLESANGNEYDITLTDAVTTAIAASDKYAIYATGVAPTAVNKNTVAIVASGTQTISATQLKSLHVMEGATATASAALTVNNLRNDGTLTAEGNLIGNILNAGNATATLKSGVVGTLANDGVIKAEGTQTAPTAFAVTAGTGDVEIEAGNANYAKVTVVAGATQRVIYVANGAVGTDEIKAAALIQSVNALRAGGLVTLKASDIAELKAIKTIILDDAGISTVEATYDLSGITIDASEISAQTTWAGTVATTVNNATIVLGTYNLQLSNINVNGTKTGTGKILADGVTAKWNGAKAQ